MMKNRPAKWKKFSLIPTWSRRHFRRRCLLSRFNILQPLKKENTHFSNPFHTIHQHKMGKKKKNQNVHKSLDGSSLARQTPTHTATTENNQKIQGNYSPWYLWKNYLKRGKKEELLGAGKKRERIFTFNSLQLLIAKKNRGWRP